MDVSEREFVEEYTSLKLEQYQIVDYGRRGSKSHYDVVRSQLREQARLLYASIRRMEMKIVWKD